MKTILPKKFKDTGTEQEVKDNNCCPRKNILIGDQLLVLGFYWFQEMELELDQEMELGRPNSI